MNKRLFFNDNSPGMISCLSSTNTKRPAKINYFGWPFNYDFTVKQFYLMVTNSSAAVGWIATVLSKSALVAPIFIATAKP